MAKYHASDCSDTEADDYGHFCDIESPMETEETVEYIVVSFETHYKVCKQVWDHRSHKYRLYFQPYITKRTRPSVPVSPPTPKPYKKHASNPSDPKSADEWFITFQIGIGITIILVYISCLFVLA